MTGKILATLPIGNGTDGGGFNPNTMEAFSSQRDGTLTIIKENSPTSFAVEQTVQTKAGCKTSSLDTKNNHIVLICTERAPQAAGEANSPAAAAGAIAAAPAISMCCGWDVDTRISNSLSTEENASGCRAQRAATFFASQADPQKRDARELKKTYLPALRLVNYHYAQSPCRAFSRISKRF